MSQSNIEIGSREIGALASDDDNPDKYIGHLVFSTTGMVHVARKWLEEQWGSHNLPEELFPREISNWSAYRRAINQIQEDEELLNYTVYNDAYEQAFNCHFEIEKSGEEGTNVYIVYARTFLPEEVNGQKGGNWSEQRVGYFDFYKGEDDDLPGALVTFAEIDDENIHHSHLMDLFDSAREKEEKMRTHHNYNDLQGILDEFRTKAQAVEIRRSVYFFPAHAEEELEGMAEIWDGLNAWKENGELVRIEKTPVVDMAEQRKIVATRVREKVEQAVGDITGEIIEEFRETEEQTADEAARKLMNQLNESEEMAGTYNQLLGIRLSIQDILDERREDLEDEADEIIENVINQQTFNEVEA